MPYSSIAVPRFYCNVLEYLEAVGYADVDYPHYHTLPVIPKEFTNYTSVAEIPFALNNPFIAFLGHELVEDYSFDVYHSDIFNGNPGDSEIQGVSISALAGNPTLINLGSVDNVKIGSVVIGSYFEMKNAPNLSLTKNIEYAPTKEITSYNGSSYSNTFWIKPPMWGEFGAWELNGYRSSTFGNDLYSGYYNQNLARSGRRTWKLKFSFMDDGDLWGSNQSLSFIANTVSGYDGQGVVDPDGDIHTVTESDGSLTDSDFNYNILTDDNFFSFYNMTLGGTIPFIFQPDKDSNEFAICRFKSNSLKATQSAFHVYDISVDLEETW